MKYQNKSFTVASPGTKEYADNWERTFRGPVCSRCNEVPQAMDPALADSPTMGAPICVYCGYWGIPPGPEREAHRAQRALPRRVRPVRGCTCTAQPDANGLTMHAPECALTGRMGEACAGYAHNPTR